MSAQKGDHETEIPFFPHFWPIEVIRQSRVLIFFWGGGGIPVSSGLYKQPQGVAQSAGNPRAGFENYN